VVEREKEINGNTLMEYLPDSGRGGVPALYKKQDSSSGGDFSNEREILYKILFDMRKDIADLKKLTGELISNEEISEEWKTDNHSLISRIYEEDEKVERNDTMLPVRNNNPSLPVYEDESARLHGSTYDAQHETIEDTPITLQEKELEMIKRALDRNNNKRKDAAKELGISERTLYRKIKQYNL
jgi:DNA-binding protein Fis